MGQVHINRDTWIKERAVEYSISGIAIGDLEGKLSYVNSAALRMLGNYDYSEVLGKPAVTFAQSKEEALEALNALLTTGRWSGDIAGRKRDGSIVMVHLDARLVYSDEGDPVCTMASFVDVTDYKRAKEEMLIKDYAIQSSINGIVIADLEGNITYVNDAFLRMWGGKDVSEVLGRPAVVFSQSAKEAMQIIQAVKDRGSWFGEVIGKRKDLTPITVQLSANLVKDDRGEPICMMASFIDVTDLKRVEKEMLWVKDYAIQSSINGIAIADLNGNITYVNEAALNMWGGKDESEVLGKSVILFGASEEDAKKALHAILEKGRWIGEGKGIRKDGSPIDVLLSASLVRDEEDRPICIMGSFVDITDRKIAEERLERLNKELESRVRERTSELLLSNERLRKEIEERRQAEKALMLKKKELKLKSLNLEEANTALKVLLKQREEDKDELQEKVLSNVKELVLPYLEKLRQSGLKDEQVIYAEICESNLKNIISPFVKRLSSRYLGFTPTEIQVATLIKEGKASKDIASVLNISVRAVEFHRNNIRKKLGLVNKKINLRSYLLTLDED